MSFIMTHLAVAKGEESSSIAERKLPVYVSVEEIFRFVEETVKEICVDILRL